MNLINYFTGDTEIVGINEEKRRVYVQHMSDRIYFDAPASAVEIAINKFKHTLHPILIPGSQVRMLNFKKET